MRILKTKIHTYRFMLDNPTDAQAYQELCERLRQDKDREFFNVLEMTPYGKNRLTFDSPNIELETEYVFSNQWNTVCGKRVFDWYEGIVYNPKCKQGHYLDITEEMRQVRRDTLVCGYCGARYQVSDNPGEFCTKCLDSEYLKETELQLLRLKPAGLHFPTREPLTEAEKSVLLPAYISRQTTGNDSRAVQKKARIRQSVIDKYTHNQKTNETEYKGFTWLLDHGVNTENCIYYSHTDKFSFGWRQPVSESVKSALLDVLVEFPFEYEIKAENNQSVSTTGKVTA